MIFNDFIDYLIADDLGFYIRPNENDDNIITICQQGEERDGWAFYGQEMISINLDKCDEYATLNSYFSSYIFRYHPYIEIFIKTPVPERKINDEDLMFYSLH